MQLNTDSINYIMESPKDIEKAIQFVLQKLNELTNVNTLEIQSDINILRDSTEIYSLIEYTEKENSLKNKAPEIAALWHPVRNGTLLPESVSVASSKKYGGMGNVDMNGKAL